MRRLERDVSFASRLTYAGQSGRITGLAPVFDGASVASGSASGSLHVWRVEYSSKPGGWAPDKYRGARLCLYRCVLGARFDASSITKVTYGHVLLNTTPNGTCACERNSS